MPATRLPRQRDTIAMPRHARLPQPPTKARYRPPPSTIVPASGAEKRCSAGAAVAVAASAVHAPPLRPLRHEYFFIAISAFTALV